MRYRGSLTSTELATVAAGPSSVKDATGPPNASCGALLTGATVTLRVLIAELAAALSMTLKATVRVALVGLLLVELKATDRSTVWYCASVPEPLSAIEPFAPA